MFFDNNRSKNVMRVMFLKFHRDSQIVSALRSICNFNGLDKLIQNSSFEKVPDKLKSAINKPNNSYPNDICEIKSVERIYKLHKKFRNKVDADKMLDKIKSCGKIKYGSGNRCFKMAVEHSLSSENKPGVYESCKLPWQELWQ